LLLYRGALSRTPKPAANTIQPFSRKSKPSPPAPIKSPREQIKLLEKRIRDLNTKLRRNTEPGQNTEPGKSSLTLKEQRELNRLVKQYQQITSELAQGDMGNNSFSRLLGEIQALQERAKQPITGVTASLGGGRIFSTSFNDLARKNLFNAKGELTKCPEWNSNQSECTESSVENCFS